MLRFLVQVKKWWHDKMDDPVHPTAVLLFYTGSLSIFHLITAICFVFIHEHIVYVQQDFIFTFTMFLVTGIAYGMYRFREKLSSCFH